MSLVNPGNKKVKSILNQPNLGRLRFLEEKYEKLTLENLELRKEISEYSESHLKHLKVLSELKKQYEDLETIMKEEKYQERMQRLKREKEDLKEIEKNLKLREQEVKKHNISELRRIGNNINQIAKIANTNNNIAESDLHLVLKELNNIWRLLNVEQQNKQIDL